MKIWSKVIITKKYNISEIQDFISEINPDVVLLDNCYVNNRKKLKFICSCGEKFEKNFSNIQQRRTLLCQNCAHKNKNKVNKEKYIIEIDSIFKKYNLLLLESVWSKEQKALCVTKDGYIGRISCYNLQQGKMFSYFSIKNNKEYLISNLNNFCSRSGWKTIVLGCSEEKNNTMNSKIKCKCECGNIYQIKISSLLYCNGYRCSFCSKSISSLELTIRKELDYYNIKYKTEFTYDNCRSKKTNSLLFFDFYLPEYNLLIEVDGEQHFSYRHQHGKTDIEKMKNFITTIKNDNAKNLFCDLNNIKLFRINTWQIKSGEYKSIIKSILNKL